MFFFINTPNFKAIQIIKIDKRKYPNQEAYLRESILDYVDKTNSVWGKTILENFDSYIDKFLIVKPKAINIEELFNKSSVAA